MKSKKSGANDIPLHQKGNTYRVCKDCHYFMLESSSGWYCTKCGRFVKRRFSSRFFYFFGVRRV